MLRLPNRIREVDMRDEGASFNLANETASFSYKEEMRQEEDAKGPSFKKAKKCGIQSPRLQMGPKHSLF